MDIVWMHMEIIDIIFKYPNEIQCEPFQILVKVNCPQCNEMDIINKIRYTDL